MASRARQIVSTKPERREVIVWMSQRVEQSGSSKRIASTAVDAFPQVFPNPRNCPQVCRNLCQKAGRWWKGREEFIERLSTVRDGRLTVTTSNIAGVGRKRWFLTAMGGGDANVELGYDMCMNF